MEIVRILEQKGVLFDNCFETAVRYHRDELCDWLLTKYRCEEFGIAKAVEYHNIKGFFFFKENLTDLNQNQINSCFFHCFSVPF